MLTRRDVLKAGAATALIGGCPFRRDEVLFNCWECAKCHHQVEPVTDLRERDEIRRRAAQTGVRRFSV